MPEFLDDLPLPALVCTREGVALAVNQAFTEWTGQTPGNQREPLPVHPDDGESWARLLERAQEPGGVAGAELRLRAASGAYRWCRVRGRLHSPVGPPTLLLVTVQDVNDLKEAGEQLRLMQEASGLGGWSLDVAAGQLTMMPETLRQLELTETPLPLTAFLERVHEEDREEVRATFAQAAESASPQTLRVEHRFLRGDGRKVWLEHHLRAEGNVSHPAARLLGTVSDSTARKEAELRLTLLARAGETLAQNLDVDETLQRLTRLTVPVLADWCAVYLLRPDGTLHPQAYTHRDPERGRVAEAYLTAFPQRIDDMGAVSRVYRENVPVLLPRITDEMLGALPISEEQRRLLRAFGFGSSLLVPLAVRGQVVGTLSLALYQAGRSFSEGDVPFVQELARRAALALENARLYEQARGRGADLEARVAERTAELAARTQALEAFAELSRDLSAQQDPAALVGRAQDILVGLLPQGVSTYYELDAGRWRLQSSRGTFRNPAVRPVLELGLPRGETPNVDRPFDTGLPFYQEHYDPGTTPAAAAQLQDIGATATLPVLVGGEPRGVLVVGTHEVRPWAAPERVLLETTARALGLALERADALRELQRERVFLSGVLRSLSEGIVACDASGRLTLFNESTAELHGLPLAPLPPERWAEHYGLYHPDGSRHMRMEEVPLYRAWRGEQVRDVEMVVRPREGESRLVLSVGGPVLGEGGQTLGAVVAMRDVTERYQAEAALREANENLRRSNQELEQFAYVASHDLQTPLRAVTSFAGLLQKRYGERLDARGHTYLSHIVQGGERMKRLVDDLLAFSRVHTQQRPPQPVDSANTLREVVELLGPELEASGGWVTSGPLPWVQADEGQLSRLLVNLIGNALKYRRPEVPPRVHVTAQPEGSLWRFAVADNGVGIDARYHEQVFVPFQRLHAQDDIEGTGLGLAVSRKIVERHGGQLWLESVPGQGSTFFLTLPGAEREVS